MKALPSFAGKQIFSLGLLMLMGFTAPCPEPIAEAPTQLTVQAADLEGAWRLRQTTGREKKATQGATAIKIMQDG